MRSTTTQTTTTQNAARSAQQQLKHSSIRCTAVPKGYCLSFSYNPNRSIPIG